jgi:erythritol transport system ATP-binding protein
VQTMTVGRNLSLASIGAFTQRIFASRKRESDLINRAIRDVHIKTEGGNAMIGSLSGGNQQKVVIGKMLATNPTVVLLDEPSRGIDIGAKSEVFKLLAEGARRGLAVVYSTSEVGECLSVAHRIVVMSRGKISAEFGPGVTKEKIMAASGEVDLEYQLSNAYGLNFCHVVADLQDETPLKGLGAAGAAFLGREIGQRTKRLIGVGYGRTLEALVDALPEQAAPNLQLVSLMGSLTRRSSANPHEVIDHLAHRTGAQAFVMPVPFMANTAADRSVLLEQRAVAEAFALADECDLMLVGIGATDGGASLVSGGMIEPADMDEIRRLGAVGEVLGHFFDIDGRAIETELSRRIVSLPVDRLRNRRIVAVAGGAVKVDAIRAVLASGLLNGLITDESTARAIVEASDGRGGERDKRTAA